MDLPVISRTTTVVYEDGDLEYLVDEQDDVKLQWSRSRPWCGQTVFVLNVKGSGIDPKELSNEEWMDQPQGD
eukprot:3553295-Karenia_brevis.AAC.1